MNKFDQQDTYKMKRKELKEYNDDLQDDLKWWEIPFILLFLGALLVFVNIVNWFSNPICRGLTLSALIGFILSVMLLLMTAYLWSV